MSITYSDAVDKKHRNKNRKTHFAIFDSGCVSFVAACTQRWCYETNLWGADWTRKEEETTCLRCKKWIDMIAAIEIPPEALEELRKYDEEVTQCLWTPMTSSISSETNSK